MSNCTNFDRSVYEIMCSFNSDVPRTEQEVFQELYDKRSRIFLGAGTSFHDFLSTLLTERKLQKTKEGYTLTKNGQRLIDELAQIV